MAMRSAELHLIGHTERHVVIDDMLGVAGVPLRAATADRCWPSRWHALGFMPLSFELAYVMENEEEPPQSREVATRSGWERW